MSKNKYKKSKLWNYFPAMISSSAFHFTFCILIFLILTAGCNQANEKTKLLKQVEQLTEQNRHLTEQLEQSESNKRQLQEQVKVLSALPEEIKEKNLYNLQRISIHKYSSFLDEDKDGKIESLGVYVQPVDEVGDKIKVYGIMEVELWDLNQPDGQALLGKWRVEPEELKKHWVAFLVINYRLTFDIKEIVKSFDKPLTLKVKFTDYLTGKIFEDQRVINP